MMNFWVCKETAINRAAEKKGIVFGRKKISSRFAQNGGCSSVG
jgi:hypothetical protein